MKINFTRKQGQYLAIIYFYTKLNGYFPSEADMQRHFRTSAPTVHDMVAAVKTNAGVLVQSPAA
jgi:repressor LexA